MGRLRAVGHTHSDAVFTNTIFVCFALSRGGMSLRVTSDEDITLFYREIGEQRVCSSRRLRTFEEEEPTCSFYGASLRVDPSSGLSHIVRQSIRGEGYVFAPNGAAAAAPLAATRLSGAQLLLLRSLPVDSIERLAHTASPSELHS